MQPKAHKVASAIGKQTGGFGSKTQRMRRTKLRRKVPFQKKVQKNIKKKQQVRIFSKNNFVLP